MTDTPLTALSREEIDQFVRATMPPGFVEEKPAEGEPQKRIALALLSYDARMFTRTALCLMSAVVKLGAVGMPVTCILREGDSMVARGRSFLASQFLEAATQCTDLVFVDLDLEWAGDELVRLCQHPVDIVGAAYPYKDESGNFPLRWPADGLMEEEYTTGKLWKVQAVTPGFFRVTRKALEKIAKDQPYLEFRDQGNKEGQRSWMFFDNLHRPTGIYDEGYVFCERARQAGFPIHLDPDMNLTHIGLKAYNHGTIREWIDKKAKAFETLESEYPGVPPLKLMDKAMGRNVDLTAESAA
jgi:hypothetical protein